MDFIWLAAGAAVIWLGYTAWQKYTTRQSGNYVMPFQRGKKSRSSTLQGPSAMLKKFQKPRTDDINRTSLIVINLYANTDMGYGSYDLLQALSTAGLRYGVMKIFHRHETKTGDGKVLFSVASVTNPGTFEIDNMGNFFTPGLTIFTDVDTVADPLYTFDLMVETAQQLIETLGGTMCEGRTSPLTANNIERIRDELYATYGEGVKS